MQFYQNIFNRLKSLQVKMKILIYLWLYVLFCIFWFQFFFYLFNLYKNFPEENFYVFGRESNSKRCPLSFCNGKKHADGKSQFHTKIENCPIAKYLYGGNIKKLNDKILNKQKTKRLNTNNKMYLFLIFLRVFSIFVLIFFL